ncbi:MAG TPA: hypothetical protein VH934_03640 [Xanthobacteraceae bacterium]|jgi:hypothetical protein
MSDPQADKPMSSGLSVRAFLFKEWPYLLMLALALFGIAYTSFARTPMMTYWVVAAPLIGAICVLTRWRDAASRDECWRLVWTQALHWAAVLVAMRLMFIADVGRMMNADASALAALVLLALGTFTAGVHVGAWRICVVGLIMAAGVPGIAWLDRSALFLLLAGLLVIAIVAPLYWHARHRH